ncbi:MAG: redoxin domain-containing protein [Planctomycetes bacterium]|nr:redoxin domain-containing protein [Planctomycetota bacterium]MBI3846284.1 redoxin domain-containing protein [Planctomycetota bacterium]
MQTTRWERRWTAVALSLSMVAFGDTAVAQEASPKPAPSTEKAEKKEMAKPKVGEAAPDFKVKDQSGAEVTLAQFKGKKNVLLAFYPKSFTGG